jgi:curved DNA-binding protein CbpA
MPSSRPDPYLTLGVSQNATDQEIRSAYRRLVKLHHPDHNAGSEVSERRFEEVQDAYARIRELRARSDQHARQPPPPPRDAKFEDRLRDLEDQVRRARAAREQAQRDAREAAAEALGRRPTDEELGYVKTDDSFSKILADAADQFAEKLRGAREHPVAHRVEDLIDELEGFITKRPPGR